MPFSANGTWTDIADTSIDLNSPITESLKRNERNNDRFLLEYIANPLEGYAATIGANPSSHNHDGFNSANITGQVLAEGQFFQNRDPAVNHVLNAYTTMVQSTNVNLIAGQVLMVWVGYAGTTETVRDNDQRANHSMRILHANVPILEATNAAPGAMIARTDVARNGPIALQVRANPPLSNQPVTQLGSWTFANIAYQLIVS